MSAATLVLSMNSSPSLYYYFGTRAMRNLEPIRILALDQEKIDYRSLAGYSRIIICRYLSFAVLLRLIMRHYLSKSLPPCIHFIDDDMAHAFQYRQLAIGYRFKTSLRYWSTSILLRLMDSKLWTSTEALANLYSSRAKQAVIRPLEYPVLKKTGSPELVYFYHGTWAHREEIEWLVPIVAEVQQKNPLATFEIIGNRTVQKWFRGIPRVRILEGMPWPAYYRHTQDHHYALGLVPCLDYRFNEFRSHTKIFDITRIGAIGLYSDSMAYQQIIENDCNGVKLKNDPHEWVEAIQYWLTAHEKRKVLYDLAHAWICEAASKNTELLN